MIKFSYVKDGVLCSTGMCQDPGHIPPPPCAGCNLVIGECSASPPAPVDDAFTVRSRRAQLLAASDWTQLPDVPLATKQAWAAYRQALRDITEQPGFPHSVVWPEPPTD